MTRFGRCLPASGRGAADRGLLTSIGLVAFALARGLGEIGRCPWIATGLDGIALCVTGRNLLTATGLDGSVRVPLLVGEVTVTGLGHAIPLAALVTARGQECCRFSLLTARSQKIEADEPDVSCGRVWGQLLSLRLPLSLKHQLAVAPPVVGGTVAALPSAVQDLARLFLSLTGSSSQGAVESTAGASVPASGVGVQLCPSAPGGGVVASCAAASTPDMAARPSSVCSAVPGSSGRQQCEEELSCPSRRRRRSSSGWTGWASKKRPRERSPSPVRSFLRREASD